MPGTSMYKRSHVLCASGAAGLGLAALGLAALIALGGCYARRSIPTDAAPSAQQSTAAPIAATPSKAQPAEAVAAPAPVQAEQAALRQDYVQIGAFATEANAQGALTWLKGRGFEAARVVRVEQGQAALFKVQAGPFQDLAAAHKALEVLKPDWPQAFIPVD